MRRKTYVVPVLAAVLTAALLTPAGPADGASALAVRTIPGTHCPAFPADNYWHADISKLPVHPRSKAWIASTARGVRLHPDFGPSYGEQPVPYGIPITIVDSSHAKVPVRFQYAAESDRVKYPLGSDSKVEGGRSADGDRHVIIVDKSTCRLYETWATRQTSSGWRAGSGATWSLTSNALRPAGWTSADAAGLPILPGLLRYDEVKAGRVDHAIRFTVPATRRAYMWPARHQAGSTSSTAYPPMGARFRLKKSFSLAGYRGDTRVVLQAMKTYGMVLADNGSSWYFQGTADNRWPSGLLDELKRIPATAFEAVKVAPLRVSSNSAKVR